MAQVHSVMHTSIHVSLFPVLFLQSFLFTCMSTSLLLIYYIAPTGLSTVPLVHLKAHAVKHTSVYISDHVSCSYLQLQTLYYNYVQNNHIYLCIVGVLYCNDDIDVIIVLLVFSQSVCNAGIYLHGVVIS